MTEQKFVGLKRTETVLHSHNYLHLDKIQLWKRLINLVKMCLLLLKVTFGVKEIWRTTKCDDFIKIRPDKFQNFFREVVKGYLPMSF